MHNSIAMFTFYVLNRKYSFWENLVQKIEIVSLSIGTKTNLNMENSMEISTFTVLERKNPCWANLAPKSKIVSLS